RRLRARRAFAIDAACRRGGDLAAVEMTPPLRRLAMPSRRLLRNSACTAVLLVMALLVLYPLALLIYGSFLIDVTDGTAKELGFETWIGAWRQPGMVQD